MKRNTQKTQVTASKKPNILKRIFSNLKQKIRIPSKKSVEEIFRKQEIKHISHEQEVSQSKYFTGTATLERKREMPLELPLGYAEDKIVIQVRDPWWIHAYWEVTWPTRTRLSQEHGEDFNRARTVLRVYDVTNIIFNGQNANRFFDINVNMDSSNWYIDTAGPGKSWCVDLGILLASGRFITIVRSNIVFTPLDSPSWITDEEWMVPEDMFARLYGLGFGFGPSSPVGKGWRERLKLQIGSPGLFSVSSPAKKEVKPRVFWLVVNTELIVYGATESNAKVTVQGKPINLRPDGTFSLRFALPDGKQVIPVVAVSSDEVEKRSITPIVTKETR
ncbi:MAG: DUF4912 domain-containing protein [Candidatus Omnitrophota bacterium]|nr:DUF4912 domain-containing protein [Candidatus Omnitrophota bacterium]